MEGQSSHRESDETLKLFIPIKRLLDSYIGSKDPPLLTKGFVSEPVLSVDLDMDVIIQTAYVRRSYDEENEILPDFILDDAFPPCWSPSDVKTYFNALSEPPSIDLPTEILASCLGLSTITETKTEHQELDNLAHFRSLLCSFDADPNPVVAVTILSGYSAHLKCIYDHVQKNAQRSVPVAPMDLENEDVMWNIPQRAYAVSTPQEGTLPVQIPNEIVSHLQRVLIASQIETLPVSAFTSAVSQWIPDGGSAEMGTLGWIEEIKHLVHMYYQQRHLMQK